MPMKLFKALRYHNHWYAEWWSAVFMVTIGVYAFLAPNSEIIHQSFIEGFLKFFPVNVVKALFINIGFFQLCMLCSESLIGRGIMAFLASTLLSWGFLNVLVYGQFHFNLIALGVFSTINLYALSRIVRGIEKNNEFF